MSVNDRDAALLAGRYDRAGPWIVGCAIFLTTLDATIVATALPSMARSFHAPTLELNGVITVYLLASAVFVPISGWLADRYGSKRVFHLSILLFTLASVLCGMAQNITQLEAARAMQGAAAAMITPVGRLVLLQRTSKADLVQAISFLGIPIVLGPVLGPPLGGFIVTYFSWRWIFLVNVPIGVLAYVLSRYFVRDVRTEASYPLDWRGFVLSSLSLAGLVYGMSNLASETLSAPAIVGPIAVGLVALTLYILHARRSPRPILDFALLRIPSFARAVFGGVFLRVAVGATPFLLALMFQIGFGLSPLLSGLITVSSAAASLIMKASAQPILRRFGFKTVLIVNTVLVAATLSACALINAGTPMIAIVALLLIFGFFRSMQYTALNTLTFADINSGGMSRASSLSSVAQQMAETISVSLSAVLLSVSLNLSGADRLAVADFAPIFGLLGFLCLLSLPLFLGMPGSSGAELSGRQAPPTGD